MPTFDVVAVGRAGLDLYAEQLGRPFEEIKSFAAYVGGTPANIAVALSRLGLHTALVSAVSDDPVGDFILHFLHEEGVDTRFMTRKPGYLSGLVLLGIMPPNYFPRVHYRNDCADQHLATEDISHASVQDTRFLVVAGTSLTHSPGREATIFAAEEAHRHGVHVALDLDYRPDLWPDPTTYADEIQGLLPFVRTIIGTQEELAAAVPQKKAPLLPDSGFAARELLRGGPEVIVEKTGEAGCRIHRNGKDEVDVPGFAVEVQNTLGAGDAFAAGYLYGRLQDWDGYRAARFGNACGAIVVTRHACSASSPTQAEVFDFIQEKGGF